MRWKRTLLLAAVLVSLFSVAVSDGHAIARAGKLGKDAVIALLAGPLALLDERSPGGRGPGALLSIKSRPYERALPTVRDRVTLLDGAPVVDIDIPLGTFAPISNPRPGDNAIPQDETPGTPISQAFIDFPGILLGDTPPLPGGSTTPPPDTPPPDTPPPNPPTPPPSSFPPPDTPPPQGTFPPQGPPTPPGSGGTPPPPPGSGGTPPPPPGIVSVPEPASWTMTVLGLLAIGAACKRDRKRRRQA